MVILGLIALEPQASLVTSQCAKLGRKNESTEEATDTGDGIRPREFQIKI